MSRLLVTLAAVAILLIGCSPEGIGGVTLVTHGSHRLEAGVRIPGAVVVAGGSLVVGSKAEIGGDLFVAEGSVLVAGTVEGDTSAIGGTLVIEPTARLAGTLRRGAAADITVEPGARLDRGVMEGTLLPEPPTVAGSPWVEIGWAFARAVVVLLLVMLIRAAAPRRVGIARHYLGGLPLASLAYGFLVALVSVSLLAFMAFTILLIPVAVVAALALILMLGVGLAGGLHAVLERYGAAKGLALGMLALVVVPSFPLIGTLLLGLAGLAALGAAALAFQRPEGHRPAAAESAPDPAG